MDKQFTEQETRVILGLNEMLRRMPPPKKMTITPTYTCACNKLKPVSEARFKHTGVRNIIDPVCKGCEKTHAGLATIVCGKCGALVGTMKPHKDKTGFVFNAGSYYHTDACSDCKPEATQVTIIEKKIFDMKVTGKRNG
jgi:hypothetical protein